MVYTTVAAFGQDGISLAENAIAPGVHTYTIHRDLNGVGGETIDIFKDGSKNWTVLSKLKDEVQHTRDQIAHIAHGFQQKLDAKELRIAELERKVAGMQHQITVLHAKKVDK